MDINGLISSLKTQGVKSFKGYGIEVEFHLGPIQAPTLSVSTPDQKGSIQADLNPANFTGNDLMSEDAILNWSVPGDQDEKEAVAMTGDAPLGA